MKIHAKVLNTVPRNPTSSQAAGGVGTLVASNKQGRPAGSPTKSPMKSSPRDQNPGAGFRRIMKGRGGRRGLGRLGRRFGGPPRRCHNLSPRMQRNSASGRYQFVNQYFSKKPHQGGQQKGPNKLTQQQRRQTGMPNMLQVKVCKDATPETITFRMEVPGFKARNVQAILRRNRVLVIRGRRKDHVSGKRVVMRERFILNPTKVHLQSISMLFDEQTEVLSVTVRKKKKHHPTRARLIPICTKDAVPLPTKEGSLDESPLDNNAMEWFEGLIPDITTNQQAQKTVERPDALTVSFQNMAVQGTSLHDDDEEDDDTSTLKTAESDSMDSELAWCYVYVDTNSPAKVAADGSQDNPEAHAHKEATTAPLEQVKEDEGEPEPESSPDQQEQTEPTSGEGMVEDATWDGVSDDGEVEHA